MPDLEDGDTASVKGSGSNVYELKNSGGVYSCSCPAWRNAGGGIDRRTCKHLKAYRGEDKEIARLGADFVPARKKPTVNADGTPAAETEGPPVLLAHKWESDVDLTGWWMSEKLDGVRAWWDGKAFISRLGNVYLAPDWFVEGLPDTPLDGELWGGRKLFQRTISIVRRQDKSQAWKEISYVVFDAPKLELPFEERVAWIAQYVAEKKPPHARAHTHEKCRDTAHLKEELARVEALGGEGLMMRRPGSKYEVGRSDSLLKVKTFHDAEAIVREHSRGEGKHKGRTGALVVEMPNGTRFSVGTGLSDRERENPPAIGSIITYRYQELSDGGVPRFPSYVGVREDMAWPPTGEQARSLTERRAAPTPTPTPKPTAAPIADAAATTDDETTEGEDMTRYFEFSDDESQKFWEITVNDANYVVRYGKIGAAGQTKIKSCASAAEAKKESDKLIAEKTGKGYAEKGGGKASTPAAVKARPAPAEEEDESDEGEDEAPSAAPSGDARYFEFVEDGSSKFWEIKIEGDSYTVRYGRIGTDGQVKTKSAGSAAAALKEATKLIEEKTGKGYQEKGGSKAVAKPAVAKPAAAPAAKVRPAAEEREEEAATPAAVSEGTHYLEFTDDGASKFWEVKVEGKTYTVRFGRIGTDGQSNPKTAASPAAALEEAAKLIAAKTANGYAAKGAAKKAAPAAPKPAPALKAVPAPKAKDEDEDEDEEDSASSGARRFEFSEDGSSKFWEITLDGSSHTVRYGRIGTDGQEKTKDFDDEDAAKQDHDKLIAEKTKKGYAEKK